MRHPGFAASVLLIGLLVSPGTPAAEIGNVCIHHFSPGITCQGTDVQLTRLELVTLLESCAAGDPATAEGTFRVWVSAATTTYDAGIFLSLNGQTAISGAQCLHDYLEPPLNTSPRFGDVDGNGRSDLLDGPWYDGEPFAMPQDFCGDVPGGTDAVKTLTFRFSCNDRDGDGIVDLHVCASSHAGTNARCDSLAEAFPPSSMRCRCNELETGIPVTGGPPPAGQITGLVAQKLPSNQVQLSWNASCSANDNDYGVYAGTLGQWSSHSRVVCTTGGSTATTLVPGAGNRYFLVVPHGLFEGSYGKNSAGLERAPASDACADQAVQRPCP